MPTALPHGTNRRACHPALLSASKGILATTLLSFWAVATLQAQTPAAKSTAPQLIELAASSSPKLPDAIRATFDAKDLKEGTAWAGRGPDFFFALESKSKPQLANGQ